ncbi:MAG: hypothetical protein SNI70_08395 [Rikenellaceae bacterium]
MSLDINFKKSGIDYDGISKKIDEVSRNIKELKAQLNDLEDQYDDGKISWHNITHNLNVMAKEAGIYEVLWHPERVNISSAKDMIPILETGVEELEKNPEKYKKYNPENGWGDYENLVKFAKSVLNDCYKYPDAIVSSNV